VRHRVRQRHVLGRKRLRPAGDREHDISDAPGDGARCESGEGVGLVARVTRGPVSVCGVSACLWTAVCEWAFRMRGSQMEPLAPIYTSLSPTHGACLSQSLCMRLDFLLRELGRDA
jgi:hypothetical protein